MIENKFKLEQRVECKNTHGYTFVIECIKRLKGETYYSDCYMSFWVKESNLELVKEKKKVTLFAPIRRDSEGKVYAETDRYYAEKGRFYNARIIGWHEIVVEVDDE